MKKSEKALIKNLLGDDIFEVLKKSQIYKPSTDSVVTIEDTKIGLQIVPRSILAFLFNKLKNMSATGNAKVEFPFVEDAYMEVNKHGPDNYSGEIIQHGKVLTNFKYRTIPGIGLVVMSSFEIYDIDILKEQSKEDENKKEDYSKLQEIIDERIRLRELIEMVVDKKLSQREAMRNIIREKIHSFLTEKRYAEDEMAEKDSPGRLFTREELSDKADKSREESESEHYKKEMREELSGLNKNTTLSCPDCDTNIYKANDNKIKCCICYGEFFGSDIKIIKKEDGCSLKFPKDFGPYNIKNLLKVIKR